MNLQSIRIITADIKRLVSFYEAITNLPAKWHTAEFAELTIGSCTLAISSTKTLAFFGGQIAEPASNKSVIIEFRVDDVDTNYSQIKDIIKDIVQEPTTMPWGNRSLLFRDPDGNLINFFTPLSQDEVKRFD